MSTRMLMFFVGLLLMSKPLWAKEWVEETRKDFPLRSIARLQLIHTKGDIQVQGWSLDKIRIEMTKRVTAENEQSAQKKFQSLQYGYQVSDSGIEISTRYGGSLSIRDRMQDQENTGVQMDLRVFAPSRLPLAVWTVKGSIQLKNWAVGEGIEIRSNTGSVVLENIYSKQLAMSCSRCTAQLHSVQVRDTLSCTSEDGAFSLKSVSAGNLYVESGSGQMKLSHLAGTQFFVIKDGAIEGESLSGKIHIQAKSGSVTLKDISGSLSGDFNEATLTAVMRDWADEESLLESSSGSMHFTVPKKTGVFFEVKSQQGKVDVRLPKGSELQASTQCKQSQSGQRGEGGGRVKMTSETGDIDLD